MHEAPAVQEGYVSTRNIRADAGEAARVALPLGRPTHARRHRRVLHAFRVRLAQYSARILRLLGCDMSRA